jgi:hypothetical protein
MPRSHTKPLPQVTENSNINADRRNQAVSASTDGVPFFKDRNAANGWPVSVWPDNAPLGKNRDNAHAHMAMLVPSEYWIVDSEGRNILKKGCVIDGHS